MKLGKLGESELVMRRDPDCFYTPHAIPRVPRCSLLLQVTALQTQQQIAADQREKEGSKFFRKTEDLQSILLINEVLQIVSKVSTTPLVCQLNKFLSSF